MWGLQICLQHHSVTKCPEVEGTPRDHRVQILSPHRTTQCSSSISQSIVQTLLVLLPFALLSAGQSSTESWRGSGMPFAPQLSIAGRCLRVASLQAFGPLVSAAGVCLGCGLGCAHWGGRPAFDPQLMCLPNWNKLNQQMSPSCAAVAEPVWRRLLTQRLPTVTVRITES